MYEIEYTPDAQDDLAYFRKHEQVLIVNEIERRLRYEPTIQTRNRKELKPNQTASWELRIAVFVFSTIQMRLCRLLESSGLAKNVITQSFFEGSKVNYDNLEL